MYVGNLNAMRDFTDVRDMVRAYWLAVEKCEVGDVYNIASDKGIKIKDMLDMLLKMSSTEIKVQQDPARMRPSDVEILLGDSTKFRKVTGWKLEIPFEKTMRDLLDYWRE
jgi:GDP-4-dehydro-6-deoxy-D-mannose reductase